MTGRAVPEWIGKTPDSPAPPRVRARVFERDHGVCVLSGRTIAAGEPWELHHVKALINGGENRESNLAPALRDKHKQRTALDVREKSIAARKRNKALGIKAKTSRPIPGSKASGWKKPFRGPAVRRA